MFFNNVTECFNRFHREELLRSALIQDESEVRAMVANVRQGEETITITPIQEVFQQWAVHL